MTKSKDLSKPKYKKKIERKVVTTIYKVVRLSIHNDINLITRSEAITGLLFVTYSPRASQFICGGDDGMPTGDRSISGPSLSNQKSILAPPILLSTTYLWRIRLISHRQVSCAFCFYLVELQWS